jgi:predicted nucleic acid-binding protein
LIRFVIDASAAVEYLLRTPLGQRLDDLIDEASLLAPSLLDVEVMSVLRRAVLQKKIEEHRARLALEDLGDWPLNRISHSVLLREAWKHRHNVSAYDAFYVAVAKLHEAPLLTADGPLSRAPGLGIVVQNIRLG